MTRSRPERSSVPSRLILPVAGVAVVLICGAALVRGSRERHSVSEVERTVRATVLAADQPGAPPAAGQIGPWSVAADEADPVTGELLEFRMQAGQIMMAAKSARIVVDPDTDTFRFELTDVVYMRVPGTDETAAGHEGRVLHMDEWVLGPVPYQVDIVPDAVAAAQ